MTSTPICNQDYLDLMEIDSQGARATIGRYCSQFTPQPSFTSANVLVLSFISDASNTAPGFNMTYYIKG